MGPSSRVLRSKEKKSQALGLAPLPVAGILGVVSLNDDLGVVVFYNS